MVTLSAIEARKIRHQAMRGLVNLLVRNANRPGQIEARVVEMAFLMGCTSLKCRTQKELAQKLGIRKSRASAAVEFARQRLAELQGELQRQAEADADFSSEKFFLR